MTNNNKNSNEVNIKILGTGCVNCKKLEANVKEALAELKIEAIVEKVTEIQDIMRYGVVSIPGLVIDEEVVLVGQVPNVEKIKQIIMSNDAKDDCAEDTCSSGGCGCDCKG